MERTRYDNTDHGQSRVYETVHPSRMLETASTIPNPARSCAPEMWVKLGDVETEKNRPITRLHEFPVPRRIDAADAYKQTVVMEPTEKPRHKVRLDQEGRRVRANMMI